MNICDSCGRKTDANNESGLCNSCEWNLEIERKKYVGVRLNR